MTKCAAVDIAAPLLIDAVGYLLAAGLQVSGSLDRGGSDASCMVRLLLTDGHGEVLPDACAERLHLISPVFVVDVVEHEVQCVRLAEVHLGEPL